VVIMPGCRIRIAGRDACGSEGAVRMLSGQAIVEWERASQNDRDPLQRSLPHRPSHHGLQCGFCTPA